MALVIVMTSATIVGVVYFLAYRNPRDFTLSHALAVLVLALAATGAGEYSREMLRKPYVIGGHMYTNGIRVKSVERLNTGGYLPNSIWVRSGVSPEHARGEAMFRGQCMACHTKTGYRSMTRLLGERDRVAIGSLLTMLHDYKPDSPYRRFMPPLAGTAEEISLLGNYLDQLANGAGKTGDAAVARK
jgi:cytochrome c553